MSRQLATLTTVLILTLGCGQPTYTPNEKEAIKSLTTMLEAWKEGKKPSTLNDSTPKIQVADFQWSANYPLDSYEIQGQEAEASSKIFTVLLKVGKPAKSVTAKYHVLGRENVMIYRDEDFNRAMNMDNSPKSAAEKKR